jgi:hypothetical protein
MISYTQNKQLIKAIVLSCLIVTFVKCFYLIPLISLYMLLVVLLILNFWNKYISNAFIFLSLLVAVMTIVPNICITSIKPYIDNKYLHIISTSALICMTSFVGGNSLLKETGKCALLIYLSLICFIGAYFFKDVLIFEKTLLIFYYLLVAIIFVYIGSHYPWGRYDNHITRFPNIAFLVCLVIIFVSSNYIIKRPISKVGLIECFSQWASTNASYTVNDITLKGGYSYSLMKEAIGNKYSLTSIDSRSELSNVLPTLDAAIIITPTIPFKNQEIQEIRKFVTNGGRLVVVVDHTDIYGHGRVVNSLLKGTGINVEYNALFNMKDYNAEVRLPSMPMNSVRPKTSCSLTFAKRGYVWGWSTNWISEKADYTNPNFFGELHWTADDLVGNWPVGGIAKYGKGEIVIWCDSTIFANFCLFQPDTLRFLGILIEGGEILSTLSPYCAWLLILFFIAVLFGKYLPINAIAYCAIGIIICSASYYMWDFDPEKFYIKNKKIDVYGDKDLFVEPPPKHLPVESNFSSAYSHIARFGLYPLYKGNEPKNPVQNRSIWITSWEKMLELDTKIYKSLWGVIIVDLNKNMHDIGFNEVCADDNVSSVFTEIFKSESHVRRMLVTNNSTHTVLYNGVPIFAAYGVMTDRYFGDWWITTNVSPYRLHMLSELSEWLINKKEISAFVYPCIGIEQGQKDWLIGIDKKDLQKRKFLVHPYRKDQRYVYFGSGIWALYGNSPSGEFLLGGPETSDNYLKNGETRWAAQALTK